MNNSKIWAQLWSTIVIGDLLNFIPFCWEGTTISKNVDIYRKLMKKIRKVIFKKSNTNCFGFFICYFFGDFSKWSTYVESEVVKMTFT